MKHLAVITARSGSKGLKDKNIKLLEGKPLLVYSIEAARQSGKFDCIHVSTDSEKYAQIAREHGWDVLRAVVQQYAAIGQQFDTITLLQPTSPLRDAADIKMAFEIFEEKNAQSVVSVCEAEHSPLLCNTLKEDQSMCGFVDLQKVGRRQDMGTYYRLNGAIYLQTTELLMSQGDLYGEHSYACVMSQEHSIDIDTALDFQIAETIMRASS